jgi:Fic family protein
MILPDSELFLDFAAASRALGTVEGIVRAVRNGAVLVQPLLRQEAIASCLLDGIEASTADLALFESSGTPATERDDVREVATYVATLQKALGRQADRAEANGGPRLVEAAIEHQTGGDRVALVAALGAVVDVSSFFVRHRDEYGARAPVAQADWLRFVFRGIAEQAGAASARLLSLDALAREWRMRVASARNSAALEPVLDALFAIPATTGARLAELMGVTYPAARKTLDGLVERGILTPTTVGKRHFFVANEVLEASAT